MYMPPEWHRRLPRWQTMETALVALQAAHADDKKGAVAEVMTLVG